MVKYLDVELSQNKMLTFYMGAVFVFIAPLILADYLYIDDNWRAQIAGMRWEGEGRLLVDWFYQGLSFTRGAPNLFPLPLLISGAAMSFALRALTNHYFFKPAFVACLVVLPLWYSPFFLQNLSYQYDGPATVLGVVAMIYAIAFRHPSVVVRAVVSTLCIAIGLSFYQMVINIYIGLWCIELIRAANECKGLRVSVVLLLEKFLQFLLGVMLYWLTAYQFITSGRTTLREFNSGWAEKLLSDGHLAAQRVALLYNDGNAWLCWALLIIACAGFGRVIYRVLRMHASLLHKLVVAGGCLLAVALVMVSIPGLALIFSFYDDGARLMMGMSSAFVLIFYLNYQALTVSHPRWAGWLIIPLIAMLSFSYAYGRVLNSQKVLSNSILQNIAYDVMSNKGLKDVERYHMVINDSRGWLAGADGAYKMIPALKYVLNVDYLVLAEMLPRSTGTTNISNFGKKTAGRFLYDIYTRETPLVDNKFYSIYIDGPDAYIVMKRVSADDVFSFY